MEADDTREITALAGGLELFKGREITVKNFIQLSNCSIYWIKISVFRSIKSKLSMCKEIWYTDIYTHKILCQKWLISTATKKKIIKKNNNPDLPP